MQNRQTYIYDIRILYDTSDGIVESIKKSLPPFTVEEKAKPINIKIEMQNGKHVIIWDNEQKDYTVKIFDLTIKKDDMLVNGKSIMGVMMLAAECGAELEIILNGVDEEDALLAIEELINNKFNEVYDYGKICISGDI